MCVYLALQAYLMLTEEKRVMETYPGTEVRNACELLCGCWDWNSGPLQQQQVLLTTDSSTPKSVTLKCAAHYVGSKLQGLHQPLVHTVYGGKRKKTTPSASALYVKGSYYVEFTKNRVNKASVSAWQVESNSQQRVCTRLEPFSPYPDHGRQDKTVVLQPRYQFFAMETCIHKSLLETFIGNLGCNTI